VRWFVSIYTIAGTVVDYFDVRCGDRGVLEDAETAWVVYLREHEGAVGFSCEGNGAETIETGAVEGVRRRDYGVAYWFQVVGIKH
jgi:hypothetical protein